MCHIRQRHTRRNFSFPHRRATCLVFLYAFSLMWTPGCTFWPPPHTHFNAFNSSPLPPPLLTHSPFFSSIIQLCLSFVAVHLHPRRGQQASPGRLGWGSQGTPSRQRACQAPSSQTPHVPSNPPPAFFAVVMLNLTLYPKPSTQSNLNSWIQNQSHPDISGKSWRGWNLGLKKQPRHSNEKKKKKTLKVRNTRHEGLLADFSIITHAPKKFKRFPLFYHFHRLWCQCHAEKKKVEF